MPEAGLKVISVAWNEFRQFVLSKTFLVLILLSPLLIALFIGLTLIAESSRDLSDRDFLVVDRTGKILDPLQEAAARHNRIDLYRQLEGGGKIQVRSRFFPKDFDSSAYPEESKLLATLSERVREEGYSGFLIIEEDVLESKAENRIRFFTENQTYQDLPRWLERTLNRIIQNLRLEAAGLDPDQVRDLTRPLDVARFGLAEIDESGAIQDPEPEDPLITFLLPLGAMMILFFCANISSPIMLNSVMEEKMQKILEVLLASVTPLQLMAGKLLGSVAVALTLAGVYIAPSVGFLIWRGYADEIPVSMLGWFPVFLLITLLSLGSVWAAIGAACSELKDTQNFAGLAVFLLIVPLILAMVILESPHAPFAVVTSILPACYPFIMTIRLLAPPGPEAWQLWLGLLLNLLFVGVALWAGSRIFRRGILSQGNTPTFRSMIRWVFEKT